MSSRSLTKAKGGPKVPDAHKERFAYDMEQARALRSGMRKAASESALLVASPPPAAGSAHAQQAAASPTASDVDLALRGLDRAGDLESSGRPDEALRVYQLSIEALIRYLNASPRTAKRSPTGLDRDVVAERVRVALTDAERLKARVSGGEGGREAREANEAQDGGAPWAVTNAITSALSWGSSQEKEKPAADAANGKMHVETEVEEVSPAAARKKECRRQDRSSKRASPGAHKSPTAGMASGGDRAHPRASTKRGSNARSPATSPTKARSPATSPAKAHPASAQPQQQRRAKRSNLDYVKDPLVRTIKSELYVDSSQIKTKWDDISGLSDAKQSLQEAAILPLLRPDLYTGLRSPPRGILLYGPPGTGKTMLVRAVAHESKCILFACTASALTSKWHGEGEKLVSTLFRMAADVAPAVLFFDEIDALLSARRGEEHEASRRFKTEFMVQMDGIVSGGSGGGGGGGDVDVQHRVLVVGCTNCPWDIDDAVMRRFQRRIYIPLPDPDARRSLLSKMLQKAGKNNHDLTSRQVTTLVAMTEGYSCSDIASIANEAAFGPLRSLGGMEAIRDVRRQDVRPMNLGDFRDAVEKTKRSVSNSLLARYASWEREQMAGGR